MSEVLAYFPENRAPAKKNSLIDFYGIVFLRVSKESPLIFCDAGTEIVFGME